MSGFTPKACVFCGKLFQSMGTRTCPVCSEQLDKDFRVVREYIYDASGNVNVHDIVKNTDVSEKTVLYLIKEGRLSESKLQSGSQWNCAACGALISKGKFCSKCLSVLRTGIQTQGSDAKQEEQITEKPESNQKMHTYRDK